MLAAVSKTEGVTNIIGIINPRIDTDSRAFILSNTDITDRWCLFLRLAAAAGAAALTATLVAGAEEVAGGWCAACQAAWEACTASTSGDQAGDRSGPDLGFAHDLIMAPGTDKTHTVVNPYFRTPPPQARLSSHAEKVSMTLQNATTYTSSSLLDCKHRRVTPGTIFILNT